MPKWNDWNLIAFGFVMGAVAGLVICTVAALNVTPLFLGNDGRLQWETLITGVAAVGAAWFTVDQLKRQIRQTGDLAERARQQRVKAARALLPLALSQLTEYFQADGCLDRSRADLPAWALPPVPEDVLPLLKECVAVMDDDPAKTAVELVSRLQIQRTRLTDYISRLQPNDGIHAVTWGHIDQGIRDAAEVYARASSLLPFARGHNTYPFDVKLDVFRYALESGGIGNADEVDALTCKYEQELLF